jgi:hypothetical protein
LEQLSGRYRSQFGTRLRVRTTGGRVQNLGFL